MALFSIFLVQSLFILLSISQISNTTASAIRYGENTASILKIEKDDSYSNRSWDSSILISKKSVNKRLSWALNCIIKLQPASVLKET